MTVDGVRGWISLVLVVIAFAYFAVISVRLAVIDVRTHRLPDAIVLPSYPVAIVPLTLASVLVADWPALGRAAAGMAVMYLFYALLRFGGSGGMGGGDVKLAGLIGWHLGWLGWSSLLLGVFAAFLLGGLFSLVLILVRRATRRTAIPFGPWMLAGAWLGVIAAVVSAVAAPALS